MSGVDDLVTWLRAQLDDDERAARKTYEVSWSAIPQGDGSSLLEGPQILSTTPDVFAEEPEAEHIARWDPARVLAEVDAKRRIIETCAFWLHEDDRGIDPCANATLRLLALPFADRDGYRDEWRP